MNQLDLISGLLKGIKTVHKLGDTVTPYHAHTFQGECLAKFSTYEEARRYAGLL